MDELLATSGARQTACATSGTAQLGRVLSGSGSGSKPGRMRRTLASPHDSAQARRANCWQRSVLVAESGLQDEGLDRIVRIDGMVAEEGKHLAVG